MVQSCMINTPVGDLIAAAQDDALVGLWITGQKYFPKHVDTFVENPSVPVLKKLLNYLGEYFTGGAPQISGIHLNPTGTPFQKQVWNLISKIPYGQTTSYGELAQQMAKTHGTSPLMCQAIGNAVGHNPILLVVPCHRVIGSDGSLTGYAAGLEVKKKLLALEGAVLPAGKNTCR